MKKTILFIVIVYAFCLTGYAESLNTDSQNQEVSTKTGAAPQKAGIVFANPQNELQIEQTISEDTVGLNLLPTEAAAYIQYGWGYYIPQDQARWKESFDAAYSKVSTIDTTPIPWEDFLPVGISLGNEISFLLHKDGSLWFLDVENNYIAPEDAAELYSMSAEVMEKLEINPVIPEAIQEVLDAVLSVNGEQYCFANPEMLLALENMLNHAALVPGLMTRCPFTSMLALSMNDGTEVIIAIAADECGLWMSDGTCYEFANTSDELYALFGIDLAAIE